MKHWKQENWISFIFVLALVLVTAPLLILGHYDYPTADDWSLAAWTHQAVVDREGILGVLKAAMRAILYRRHSGEPRFASTLLAALQPGIWGEHFYRITPYLMIGSLIFSELLLGSFLLRRYCKAERRWICPILIPSLIFQILFVPYPTETFYWYVGAVNYTFIFSLSLILLYLFLRLSDETINKKTVISSEILGIAIAVLVGGNNYSASLSAACLFICLSAYCLLKNKKGFLHTLPLTFAVLISLLLCLTAPANKMRVDHFFGGTTNGIMESVWMSISRTCLNIYSWTTLKVILLVLLISPFLWLALKNAPMPFQKPVLFTLFSLGIYAAQITANMYVEGGISACRIADILYYGYHVWLLLNIGYWIGWLQRQKIMQNASFKIQLLPWTCVIGLILTVTVCFTDIKTSSTYRACAWLLQGTAASYAEVWEERLAVLRDDSVKNVEFEPIQLGQEMVFYADFDPQSPWFSEVCAEYYNKESITLR